MKGSQIKNFQISKEINQGIGQNQKARAERTERVHFEIGRHIEQQGSIREMKEVGDNVLRDLLQ